jgi:chromosome segregation ATPase
VNKLESERDQAQIDVESLQRKLNETEALFGDLRDRHEQLTRQLAEVHSSDSNIESCKKEIQQLRNKNSYLEKQVSELTEVILYKFDIKK